MTGDKSSTTIPTEDSAACVQYIKMASRHLYADLTTYSIYSIDVARVHITLQHVRKTLNSGPKVLATTRFYNLFQTIH
ncbi:hypothetical protein ACTXT7_007891 [Hymenolepis weldensis]